MNCKNSIIWIESQSPCDATIINNKAKKESDADFINEKNAHHMLNLHFFPLA